MNGGKSSINRPVPASIHSRSGLGRGHCRQNPVPPLGAGTWRHDSVLPVCEASGSERRKGHHGSATAVVPVVATDQPTIQIIGQGEKPAAFDYHCPLLSLPLAFRTTLETIPAAIPYLHADPDRAARWRHRLAALPGHKVGLVWAGDPKMSGEHGSVITMDQRRSITLDHFSPLAAGGRRNFCRCRKARPPPRREPHPGHGAARLDG